MKSRLALIGLLCFGLNTYGQHIIETADRYTNSFKNKTPKSDLYMVFGFTPELEPYFFNENEEALIIVLKESTKKEELLVAKTDFYKNKKTGYLEYYYKISSAFKLPEQELFKVVLSSGDGANYSITEMTEKDQKKLIKLYGIPGADASNKEKLKYFKKTGDSQGQLMGATNEIVLKKRTKCSVKKREYGKNGINGVKEMTYSMH